MNPVPYFHAPKFRLPNVPRGRYPYNLRPPFALTLPPIPMSPKFRLPNVPSWRYPYNLRPPFA